LPNGYSDAPRVFTKLLKPVFAQLRRLGHIVVGYIDDIYIQARTEHECKQAVDSAVSVLEQCGFVIHPEKSCFLPAKTAVYLGFELNSENMTVQLTLEKKQKYIQSCKELIQCQSVPIRTLAKVIGQLVSTFPGVKYGPLHYREMEKAKICSLQMNEQDYDAVVQINSDIKSELAWWIENLGEASNDIMKGPVEVELMTDATLEHWGAKCGLHSTGGDFSVEEKYWSHGNINACELLAIYLSLQAFINVLKGKNVLVRSDNMVAITYISQMGGTKSVLCNDIARTIWNWCKDQNIWLSAEHIAGVLNIYADYESRHVDDRLEWAIYPDVFASLCQRFGTPEMICLPLV